MHDKFNGHPMTLTHPGNGYEACDRQQEMERRRICEATQTNVFHSCPCISRTTWKSVLIVFSLARFPDDVRSFSFAHRR